MEDPSIFHCVCIILSLHGFIMLLISCTNNIQKELIKRTAGWLRFRSSDKLQTGRVSLGIVTKGTCSGTGARLEDDDLLNRRTKAINSDRVCCANEQVSELKINLNNCAIEYSRDVLRFNQLLVDVVNHERLDLVLQLEGLQGLFKLSRNRPTGSVVDRIST